MSDNENGAIDEAALGRYLEEHIVGFEGLEKVVKFQAGQSNPTYRVDAASGTYVLRAKPPGELLKSAHQVDREYRVMKALADTPVPVPGMLHLANAAESPLGRTFFVMEHLGGRILWDPALPEIGDAETRERIYDAMNGVLAALHEVDVEAAGLSDFGRPTGYFRRQLSRWSEQYRQSKTDELDDMETLMAWLEDNLPADDTRACLVHGDFRMDNMIFSNDDESVRALLDWELATLGHPLADLAYQCMQWRLPNTGVFKGLGAIDRASAGIPTEEQYVARYCERRGIARPDDWPFYLAFSFFRLAAILQGVFKRYCDGNASNPQQAKAYGANVPSIAQQAVTLIREEA